MVVLRLFALVTRKWGITIRLKLANLLRLGMEKTLQKARLLLHTGLTKCSGLVKVAQQNPLLNLKNTLRALSGALSVFLFMGTATAHDQDEVLKQYIRILDLELFNRYAGYTAPKPPIPRAKPSRVPVPRYRPAHSLTTYRDLYVYVVQPHDYISKRIIKCYSVGIDKYGYVIKIPCKETKVKEQSQ